MVLIPCRSGSFERSGSLTYAGERLNHFVILSSIPRRLFHADTIHRLGSCDVRKKEDLDRVVKDISSKEKHVNLLGTNRSRLFGLWNHAY